MNTIPSAFADLTATAHEFRYSVSVSTGIGGWVNIQITSDDNALPVADQPASYLNFDGTAAAMPSYDACVTSYEYDGDHYLTVSSFTAGVDELVEFARKTFLELAFKAVA